MADLIKLDPKNQSDILKWASKNVVDGVINLTHSEQNQKMVSAYFRYLIEKAGGKTKDGRASKAGAKLPKLIFDGKEWSSGLFKNRGRKGVTNASGFSWTDPKSKSASDLTRVRNIDEQTLGGLELYDWNNKPEGIHAHHLRGLYLFAPFFEGLQTPEDRRELARFAMEELDMPLGNLKGNLAELQPKVHDAIHRWMRANGVEVYGDKLPKLEGYNLDQMKEALSLYQEYVQKPVEDQLELIKNKVSLYEPKEGDLRLMKSVGMNWDEKTGQFITSTASNLPTEYSDKTPGSGFNLSNMFSIGPKYDKMQEPHVLRSLTQQGVRQKENWLGKPATAVSKAVLNTVSKNALSTGEAVVKTASQLGQGNVIGAAKTVAGEEIKKNLIKTDILPLNDQLKISGY